jgi:hypothetical protein
MVEVGRPQPRQDDDRLRRPARRQLQQRHGDHERRNAEKTARLEGEKKR